MQAWDQRTEGPKDPKPYAISQQTQRVCLFVRWPATVTISHYTILIYSALRHTPDYQEVRSLFC